ncbi:Integrin alpha-9-like protein, partial [Dinothrombium tinctorium]
MSGFSSAFSQDKRRLILGAPGFYQWRGAVVTYFLEGFKRHTNPEMIQYSQTVDTDSYLGYSLASGYFDDSGKEQVVAGAPKDSFYRGSVYIFPIEARFGENLFTVVKVYHGTQFGEYFGSALITPDVNNDKLNDLIVGAPLYSPPSREADDCGRIYVYISNGNTFNEPQIIAGPNKPNARFGSALCNLEDINMDGFKDIAVGAPYEDENKGAVYIYHGKRNGLIDRYVQVE